MNYRNCLLFVIQASVILLDCNALDGEGIVGGDIAPAGRYPYHVAVIKNNKNSCGGGLISKYRVITAAHCVTDNEGNICNARYRVEGGTADLRSPRRQKSHVNKIYIPAVYKTNPEYVNDIAILKLVRPLDFGPGTFLNLPNKYETHIDEYAIVTGYGWNQIDFNLNVSTARITINGESDYKLRAADVQILSHDACQTTWDNAEIPRAQLCGQMVQRDPNNPEGICNGDSGGPLVLEDNVIVGVVNQSPGLCTEDERPSIYARVSFHIGFIKKSIRDELDASIKSMELSTAPRVDETALHERFSVLNINARRETDALY